MEETLRRACIERLKEELVPAMGCTEPIAVAYAAALAKKTLGKLPERAEIEVSGNILKNVKSVIVPHTGGLRGVESAAGAGFVVPIARDVMRMPGLPAGPAALGMDIDAQGKISGLF